MNLTRSADVDTSPPDELNKPIHILPAFRYRSLNLLITGCDYLAGVARMLFKNLRRRHESSSCHILVG